MSKGKRKILKFVTLVFLTISLAFPLISFPAMAVNYKAGCAANPTSCAIPFSQTMAGALANPTPAAVAPVSINKNTLKSSGIGYGASKLVPGVVVGSGVALARGLAVANGFFLAADTAAAIADLIFADYCFAYRVAGTSYLGSGGHTPTPNNEVFSHPIMTKSSALLPELKFESNGFFPNAGEELGIYVAGNWLTGVVWHTPNSTGRWGKSAEASIVPCSSFTTWNGLPQSARNEGVGILI